MPRHVHDESASARPTRGKKKTSGSSTRSAASGTASPPATLADALADTLRPASLDEFVGQDRVVDVLRTMTRAARLSDPPRAVGHVLFYGPPGLGKTTLAQCVAREAGSRLHVASAPAMSRLADVVSLLTVLDPGDVLFIDEVHRLPSALEEALYGAMEDNRVRWFIDQGQKSRSMELTLPMWTLVAATTRPGMVSRPMMDRFQQSLELEPYDVEALTRIVLRSASRMHLDVTEDAARCVAERSRDTPRLANQLLAWVRDVAVADDHAVVDVVVVRNALERRGIDTVGLDRLAQRYLEYLASQRGAVGLGTIAAFLGQTEDTVSDQVEPFLLRRGLVERTRTGRRATRAGRAHVAGR